MLLRGCTQKLLRWPVLIVVFAILGLEFLAYLLVRFFVSIYESPSYFRFRSKKQALANAKDFVSWVTAARELDTLEGRDAWKNEDSSPFYDPLLIKQHIARLMDMRTAKNYEGLMLCLKQIYQTYNVGGINNSQLYSQTNFGTKHLVHDFIQIVLESTILVRDAGEIPLQTRREFFRRARKWYGRSALLLSGGAAMGYYHIGVLKTLIEARCLPQILSGASAGSLMCSFIAVRTDAEVLAELCVPEAEKLFRACEEAFCVKLTRWLRYGYAFDKDQWIAQMRANITKGDTTFLEAYQRTGRIINVAVTSTTKYAPTLLLNYKTTPDVVIWSAVLASSAFPNVIAPVELLIKSPLSGKLEPFHLHGATFTDGTIKNDIPIKQIAKMWNANFFIVSQVNPHTVPFFFAQRGGTGRPTASYSTTSASSSVTSSRGGFVLSMFEKLLKLEIKKWFKFLADLDLLPAIFGVDWRFIYLQKLTGTVTIVPDAPLWSYLRIISDPTYYYMQQYIQRGEKATWYKLCRLSNHYRLERLLSECSRFLDVEAKKAGLPPLKGERERVSHINEGVTDADLARGASLNARHDASQPEGSNQTVPAIQPVPNSSHHHHAHAANHTSASSSTKKGVSAVFTGPFSRESFASPDEDSGGSPFASPADSPRFSPEVNGNGNGLHPTGLARRQRSGDGPSTPSDTGANGNGNSNGVDYSFSNEDISAVHGDGEQLPDRFTLTASVLNQPSLPLWKRGMDTDTDHTDDDADNAHEHSK